MAQEAHIEESPDYELFSSLRYDPQLGSAVDRGVLQAEGQLPTSKDFYMLTFHRDRMLSAATHFQWKAAITAITGTEGLLRLEQALADAVSAHHHETSGNEHNAPLRVRTLLSKAGTIAIELSPTPPVPFSNLYPTTLSPPSSSSSSPSPKEPFTPSPRTGGALTLDPTKSTHLPTPPTPWRVTLDSIPTTPSPFTAFKTTSRDMYTAARARAGIESMSAQAEVVLYNPDREIMEGSLTSVFFFRGGQWVTPSVSSGGQVGTTRRWLLQKGLCVEGVITVDSVRDGEDCWVSNGVRGLVWGQVRL